MDNKKYDMKIWKEKRPQMEIKCMLLGFDIGGFFQGKTQKI